MDRQLYEGTLLESAQTAGKLRTLLGEVAADLLALRHAVGSRDESLIDLADELHKDVAVALALLVAQLRQQTKEAQEDPDYLAAVDAAYGAATDWIRSGLGRGEEAWRRDAVRSMVRSGGSQGFTEEEFNRIRVEVSTRFASLDDFFRVRLQQVWAEVAKAFSGSLGTLLPDPERPDALSRLRELATDADEPCPTISRAIEDLLSVRLEYRYQLYPHVRAELDGLQNQQGDTVQITVPVSEAGAEQLYRFLLGRAEQAAFLTKGALLSEAVSPALIFHALVEQFDDTVIRSEHSAAEFRGLARSYAGEIWPDLYGRQEGARAKIAAVKAASDTVSTSLTAIESEVSL
jgi:hypothetical protein